MQERTRICLTLRPEIVNLVDSRIDGVILRNRSHAIEHFLKEMLFQPIQEAVIFAADEEKPLKLLGRKTVLERMIIRLKRAGISKLIICTSNQNNLIKEFLHNNKNFGLKVEYLKNELNGTAQTLLACRSKLNSEKFLLLYGDIYSEIDFVDLVDYHNSHKNEATMVVTSTPDPLPWGVVRLKRDRIVEFNEKPVSKARLTNIINAGIFIFRPEIFNYIKSNSYSLEKDIFPQLASHNKLQAYILDGAWFDIGTESQYQLAQSFMQDNLSFSTEN